MSALALTDAGRAELSLASLLSRTRRWALRGETVLTRTLGAGVVPGPWVHWPKGDAHDPTAGFRWFYHCHPGGGRTPGEHGHFHLFADRHGGDKVTHLVAVSVDAWGLPCGLFAPNRWVTGEHWRAASEVLEVIERFALSRPVALRPVHQWLRSLLNAFMPQVCVVLADRDRRLTTLRQRLTSDVLEDRRIPVLSRRAISLADRAQALSR
jgi:hypothetical protein